MKDYYYILGVHSDSNPNEIKKAYRKLSQKFHPDKNGDDDFFAERFKEIQEAYEVLKDDIKRSRYDSLRRAFYFSSRLTPVIEYFKSNRTEILKEEIVTFSWRTKDADSVILNPFGPVSPSGTKKVKIGNANSDYIIVELVAENSISGESVTEKLKIKYNRGTKTSKNNSSKSTIQKKQNSHRKLIFVNAIFKPLIVIAIILLTLYLISLV